MQDVEFETDPVVLPDHFDFSSFGRRMKIESLPVVAEAQGDYVGLPSVAQAQPADPAPSDDVVDSPAIRDLSIVSTHEISISFCPRAAPRRPGGRQGVTMVNGVLKNKLTLFVACHPRVLLAGVQSSENLWNPDTNVRE
jgi:hypothetical protein